MYITTIELREKGMSMPPQQNPTNLDHEPVQPVPAQPQPVQSGVPAANNDQQESQSPNISSPSPAPAQPVKQSNIVQVVLVVLGVLLFIGAAYFAATYFLLGNDAKDSKVPSGNSGRDSLVLSQQDVQRKNDSSRYAAAISEYIANNNGRMPVNAAEINDYLSSGSSNGLPASDPATNNEYELVDDEPTSGQIQYRSGANCEGSELVAGARRQFAIRIMLSDSSFYCTGI